jgi:murein L,D-transpeptidase YafK
VTTFPVLAASGKAGPKRREGDRQVPEGFYQIDRFNPESSYHLSLGLDYPNESDRVRSDKQRPGSDIFIHGKDVTIGCLPLGDEMIEELYLATLDARGAGQQRIPVHIFPARMTGEKWERFQKTEAERDSSLPAFWRELQPVFDAFEKERRLPEISVAADGKYVISQPTGHA